MIFRCWQKNQTAKRKWTWTIFRLQERSSESSRLRNFPKVCKSMIHIFLCASETSYKPFQWFILPIPGRQRYWSASGGKYHSLNLQIFEVHNNVTAVTRWKPAPDPGSSMTNCAWHIWGFRSSKPPPSLATVMQQRSAFPSRSLKLLQTELETSGVKWNIIFNIFFVPRCPPQCSSRELRWFHIGLAE